VAGHDEISACVHRDIRHVLIVKKRRIDLEARSTRVSIGCESLSENTPVRVVFEFNCPDNDEIPEGIDGHGGFDLGKNRANKQLCA
jgi:hypothetical protein